MADERRAGLTHYFIGAARLHDDGIDELISAMSRVTASPGSINAEPIRESYRRRIEAAARMKRLPSEESRAHH